MIAKYILIGLLMFSLGINISDHGKERKPTNAYITLISVIIWFTLLYFSGFFEEI